MGVRSRTANYHSIGYFDNYYYLSYRKNRTTGAQSFRNETTRSRLAHWEKRGEYSSNPTIQLPGTSTRWRPPSNYTRGVLNLSYESAEWWKIAHLTSTDTMELDFCTNAARHASALPGKWTSWWSCVESFNKRYQAETECLNKIADGKAQLGASLGEARRTANMIGGLVSNVSRALIYIRRRNWTAAANVLGISRKQLGSGRSLANGYLQFKYGWRPLLSEIRGLHELLIRQLEPALLVKERRTLKEVFDITINDVDPSYKQELITERCEVIGTLQRDHVVMLTGQLTDAYLRTINQAGLSSPVSIAWELVPFSFVIDWLIPIGNVLEALEASRGLSFVGGHRTVKGVLDVRVEQRPPNFPENAGANRRKVSIRGHSLRRVSYTSWPNPIPYFRSPFRTSNVLSAIALLRQARSGSRQFR